MAMINDGSFPSPMWAVVRLLAADNNSVSLDQARSVLSPTVLFGGEVDKEATFDRAVRTLRDLGFVTWDETRLGLSEWANQAPIADLDAYTDLLRRAVLDPERNTGLADNDSQTGPRDLVRALAWFLTQDPLGPPLGWQEVAERQGGAFAEHVGRPVVNPNRWNMFCGWAPALGFATPPVLSGEGKGGERLIPDCTPAVKRTVQTRWRKGDRVDAVEVVAGVLDALPVLPGGRYSQALGLPVPSHRQAPSLSHALLRGHDEGWIALASRSDAAREILLADPDAASGTRRVAIIVVLEDLHG
jgi:hypothetical protein